MLNKRSKIKKLSTPHHRRAYCVKACHGHNHEGDPCLRYLMSHLPCTLPRTPYNRTNYKFPHQRCMLGGKAQSLVNLSLAVRCNEQPTNTCLHEGECRYPIKSMSRHLGCLPTQMQLESMTSTSQPSRDQHEDTLLRLFAIKRKGYPVFVLCGPQVSSTKSSCSKQSPLIVTTHNGAYRRPQICTLQAHRR